MLNSGPGTPVPIAEAVEKTAIWRQYYANIVNAFNAASATPSTPIDLDDPQVFRGFMIPIEDLIALKDAIIELEKEQQMGGARVYLCKDDLTNDASSMHVYLVPVTESGTDVLEREVDEGKVSTIFDFTTPCPDFCDKSSKLYKLT